MIVTILERRFEIPNQYEIVPFDEQAQVGDRSYYVSTGSLVNLQRWLDCQPPLHPVTADRRPELIRSEVSSTRCKYMTGSTLLLRRKPLVGVWPSCRVIRDGKLV